MVSFLYFVHFICEFLPFFVSEDGYFFVSVYSFLAYLSDMTKKNRMTGIFFDASIKMMIAIKSHTFINKEEEKYERNKIKEEKKKLNQGAHAKIYAVGVIVAVTM